MEDPQKRRVCDQQMRLLATGLTETNNDVDTSLEHQDNYLRI